MKIKTAKEARELTEAMVEVSANRTLETIAVEIDKAISKGKYEITLNESLSYKVVNILKDNGYVVNTLYNQREGSYTKISW